jgi:hypothetical protein
MMEIIYNGSYIFATCLSYLGQSICHHASAVGLQLGAVRLWYSIEFVSVGFYSHTGGQIVHSLDLQQLNSKKDDFYGFAVLNYCSSLQSCYLRECNNSQQLELILI